MMSHRGGRGYGGSSYRGSRGSWGSDSRSGRGGSRGMMSSYGSSRGGSFGTHRPSDRNIGGRYWSGSTPDNIGNSSSFGSSYNSRSNDSMRYSNSSSRGDSSFKRPYSNRSDNSSYGNRDLSSHRSPERKKIRSEVQGDRSPRGINIRRSHDSSSYGDYGANGGSSGHHRYDSSGSAAGGSSGVHNSTGRYSSERRSFGSERRPNSGNSFRPPAPPPPRHDDYRKPSTMSTPRGPYRGRISSRGMPRLASRRRFIGGDTLSRTRLWRSSDHMRKMKLAKLRSLRRITNMKRYRRTLNSRRSSEKDDSDKSDKEEEKKKTTDKSVSDTEKKSPKANGEGSPSKKDKDEEKANDSSDNEPRSRYTGRKFIRLTCVHCNERCVTFKEYSAHLQRSRHLAAMRRVAIKQKSVLSRMRIQQRNKQRDLDKDDDNPSSRKNFCLLCKLNYKQLKAVHQSSDAHKEMKRFLMPFCKVCRITFRSPMLYENHVCSLEHIKRKAQLDNDEKSRVEGAAGSGNEGEGELNLDNFLTLDSVGDVDDEEGGTTESKKDNEDQESIVSKAKKESINVGQDYIRKIEVLYCDLCRTYLTSATSSTSEERRAAVIKAHCRARTHLKRYVRKTEDAALRETAERMHRTNQAKNEAKEKKDVDEKDDTEEKDKKNDDTEKAADKIVAEDEKEDEKMWADVDKDLGDLLAEVEPGAKSEDDEDEEKEGGERYDRFKHSEKGKLTNLEKGDKDEKTEKEDLVETSVKVEEKK